MKFFIYLSPFISLLLLAVRVIEFSNYFLCFFTSILILIIILLLYKFGSIVMHAIMIPYDMIHIIIG